MKKFLLLVLVLYNTCFATTYYVKVAGGTGSGLDFANAWSYAYYNSIASSLPAGSGVNFLRGETYYGSLNVKSGTSGNATTYGTYGNGANPVISGYTQPTAWTNYSGHIYYTSISFSQVQNVAVDGVVRGMGRYPNTGWITYTGTDATQTPSVSPGTYITSAAITSLPASYVGGEVVIKKYRYLIDRHKITNQAANKITFTSNNFYGQNASNPAVINNGFFVQNHIATLDLDGEWSYDASTSRLYMYFNSTPAGRNVQVSTINALVSINSASYITFNNIDFVGGITGAANNGSSDIIFNGCSFNQTPTGIYGNVCTRIQVNNCIFSECTTNGIFVEARGSFITVDGNLVQHCGLIPGANESGDGKSSGISITGNDLIITNNTINNIGYNGIAFDGSNVLVEHNKVDTFNSIKDDGGGIYTFTSPPDTVPNDVTSSRVNRIIRNNIVQNAIGAPDGANWNGDPNGEAAFIYLDGFSNHTIVSGNQCAHGPWSGILNNANSNNSILNNTVYDAEYPFACTVTGLSPNYGSVRNLVVTGNTFVARTSSQHTMFIDLGVNENLALIGTINNNYLARPLGTASSIRVKQYGGSIVDMSLATWRSNYGYDLASTSSSVTTNSLTNFRYEYNFSGSTITVPLGANYIDVANTPLAGTISLAPFSSRVLLYTSAITTGRFKVFTNGAGKVYVTNGQLIIGL